MNNSTVNLRSDVFAAMNRFNELFGNMFRFEAEDMKNYETCYAEVFRNGTNFSFMSSVFFAQFSTEILLGLLASEPFRKYVIEQLDEEKECHGICEYWHENMRTSRFGLKNHDYTRDNENLMNMMNGTYIRIQSLNEWYGTDEGKSAFESYKLSVDSKNDIKRITCEYPYLIRRFDHDKRFANEIMEHAGCISETLRQKTHK